MIYDLAGVALGTIVASLWFERAWRGRLREELKRGLAPWERRLERVEREVRSLVERRAP